MSRATINQLETGALKDLGVAKLAALMDLVGLQLDAGLRLGQRHGLLMAGRTSSVSYKTGRWTSHAAPQESGRK